MGPRWFESRSDGTSGIGDRPDCRPLQETCHWQTGSGEASVHMERLSGDELELVATLPGAPDRVMVLLTGETMYMGEYPLRMETTDESGRYRLRFVPPYCTTGDAMTWRASLRADGDSMDLPFKVLFQPTE
ncbi:hypothetical protein [Marinobacter sp. OP 3.4]|uniref:hypothetical protein n=1 Tax=Marinobacter sp. OP 3.4 TaxID=3076501 RepID=UPI002E1BBA90